MIIAIVMTAVCLYLAVGLFYIYQFEDPTGKLNCHEDAATFYGVWIAWIIFAIWNIFRRFYVKFLIRWRRHWKKGARPIGDE